MGGEVNFNKFLGKGLVLSQWYEQIRSTRPWLMLWDVWPSQTLKFELPYYKHLRFAKGSGAINALELEMSSVKKFQTVERSRNSLSFAKKRFSLKQVKFRFRIWAVRSSASKSSFFTRHSRSNISHVRLKSRLLCSYNNRGLKLSALNPAAIHIKCILFWQ